MIARFKPLLHTLIIVAILSATISPACAFISGTYGEWVEICAGLTSVKIKDQNQTTPPNVTDTGCPFCFQFHNGHAMTAAPMVVVKIKQPAFHGGFYSESAAVQYLKTRHSRAPPIFS